MLALVRAGRTDVVRHSDTLYVAALVGRQLVRNRLASDAAVLQGSLLEGARGRLRDVVVGPDDALYLATSNRARSQGRSHPPPGAVRRMPGDDMAHDDMLRQFFLGFIKLHILHHAGEEPVYGLALIAELRRHGYEMSPGTLYPVLHQLEKAGYLRRLNRVVNGKVRKYYALTRRGGHALSDARAKVAELVGEVLEANVAKGRRKSGKPR